MLSRRISPDVFDGFCRRRGYLGHHLVVAVCFVGGWGPGPGDTVASSRHTWHAPPLSANLPIIAGFSSVPPKLVKRIVEKEYVDIWELLPESWQIETEGSYCHAKRPRRNLVTDINVWTECFTTMAAILATAYPVKAPHF